jgi:Ser/Thr protein kinase RdoA (MazF antagonist)
MVGNGMEWLMKDFYDLTFEERGQRLYPMALAALERYDLEVSNVLLLTNSTNGVFRVDTEGELKFVLRISDPLGCLSLDEIRSEMMWLAALDRDTNLGIPRPVTTREGSLVTTVEVDGVPEARHCAVFNWVPGRNLSEQLTPKNMVKLGELAAQLHNHAEGFDPPKGFRVRKRDNVFPFANPDFPYVEPIVLFDENYGEYFPPQRRELFEKLISLAQGAVDALYVHEEGLRVIHNDLHQWNVKVHEGSVYGLDFENLMWGYPVQDIATTLFYVNWIERGDELKNAYQRGYTSINVWPEEVEGQIDTFIAGHGAMLINYLLICDTHEDYQLATYYIKRVERLMRTLFDN